MRRPQNERCEKLQGNSVRRVGFVAVFFVACLCFATTLIPTASADIIIGGITFDDDAFADELISASPATGTGDFAAQVVTPGPTNNFSLLTLPADLSILEGLMIGADKTTAAAFLSPTSSATLGFTDIIPVDGPGADIAIFDLGFIESFDVIIGGVTNNYTVVFSGDSIFGLEINVALIDLADFGVSSTNEITIFGGDFEDDPDIMAVGAINTIPIPEPSTFALTTLALVALLARGHRRSRA